MARSKKLCGIAKATGRDLRTTLYPNLVYDDNVLSEKINEAFVSEIRGYSPLSENVLVASEDDEPLSATEATVARKLRAVSTSRTGADFLASFLECRVPHVWKLADVPPLPKVPTICDFIKDVRPIYQTSTLSKVAEGIVIVKELKPTILSSIDPGQFSFIPGSSTSTTFALISMLHHWLDYRKAFDARGLNVTQNVT